MHLNACIQHYRNKVEWWEIIYSLEGWAEHFATNEYNVAVADYAPQIIVKLEMLKEHINYGIKIFEADIDCLINMHGLNIEEAKSDPKIKPLLKQFKYKN